MEIRKAVKSGNSSLVVALPKNWIDDSNIKRGDRLMMIEKDDHSLSILPEKDSKTEKEEKEVLMDITDMDAFNIKRDIQSAYVKGCAHLTIKGEGVLENHEVIKNTIAHMIAFEIVEETSDVVVARSFLDPTSINIDNIIRRMDNILRAMLTDLKDAYKDETMSKILNDRYKEIDRLGFLILKIIYHATKERSLARELGLDSHKLIIYSRVNARIAKLAEKLKNCILVLGDPKSETFDMDIVIKKVNDLYKMHTDLMTGFYKRDDKISDQVKAKIPDFQERCDNTIAAKRTLEIVKIISQFKAYSAHLSDLSDMIRYMMD